MINVIRNPISQPALYQSRPQAHSHQSQASRPVSLLLPYIRLQKLPLRRRSHYKTTPLNVSAFLFSWNLPSNVAKSGFKRQQIQELRRYDIVEFSGRGS
jgi:hypothetical protein